MALNAADTLSYIEGLIIGLETRLKAHDEGLNDNGVSPTGDDYNALFNEVIDLAEQARVTIDNFRNGGQK
jgi:hypothetical protein